MGNSHLASLKLGWQRVGGRRGATELTFFGSPGLGFRDLTLRNRRLEADRPELAADLRWTSGSDAIELDRFDAFVLVALQFAPTRVSQLARQFSYVDERLDPCKRLVSRACFEQSIVDGLQASIAVSLARTIVGCIDRPVILSPQPHVSAAWRKTEAFRAGFLRAPDGCWQLLADLWRESASRVARDVGAELLFQPEETVEDWFFTRHRYCRESVMLSEGYASPHPEDDFVHMNGEYGELTVGKLLEAEW